MKRVQIFLALVPAIALGFGVLQAVFLYGLNSPWLQILEAGDYIARALSVLPSMFIVGVVGFLTGAFFRPMRGVGEDYETYSKRTGIDEKFRRHDDFAAMLTFIFVVFILFTSKPVEVPLFLFILILLNFHYIIHVLDDSFGGRLYAWLKHDSYVRTWFLMAAIMLVFWTWHSAERDRERMRTFDKSSNCEEAICIGDRLLVDHIAAGAVLYREGKLFVLAPDQELVVSGPYDPGTGKILLCRLPRL